MEQDQENMEQGQAAIPTQEFKTLAEEKHFFGELRTLRPGEPDPANYAPNQEKDYEADVAEFRQREAIREGVAEVFRPDLRPDLPDDEFKLIRNDALDWEKTYLEKAELARRQGHYEEAEAHVARSKFKLDELAKLGPSKREKQAEEERQRQTFFAVSKLGEAGLDKHPIWSTERMQNDAGIMIHQQNRDSLANIIVIPREKEKWGNLEDIRPSHMVFVQFPDKATYERVRNAIYFSGGAQDPESLFKRSWQVLRQSGYANSAEPTFKDPPKHSSAEPKNKVSELKDLPQKEFEAEMEKRTGYRF